MRITLSIQQLQKIIDKAREVYSYDDDSSDNVEIDLLVQSDIFGVADTVKVSLDSKWNECFSKTIISTLEDISIDGLHAEVRQWLDENNFEQVSLDEIELSRFSPTQRIERDNFMRRFEQF